jgi:sirohydrochlorin cobaltochelatase
MPFRDAALLIVGHGSTVNPDSSAPTLAHTAAIRAREIFAEVACCFWKEEPSLRDAPFLFRDPAIKEVYVVPNFISEGYFTQTVIPRELELNGGVTERVDGQVWKYCQPVGNHPAMTDLLLQRAQEAAPGVPESQTSLLIVGHGTDLNDNSAVAAKSQAEKIREMKRFAAVFNVYMEEPPLVSDWVKLTNTKNVIAVPFFISDGLHSYHDIPVLLGIGREPASAGREAVFRQNPYQVEGRALYYANSLGHDPRMAEIIVEQAEAFDRVEEFPHSLSEESRAKVHC